MLSQNEKNKLLAIIQNELKELEYDLQGGCHVSDEIKEMNTIINKLQQL